MYIERINQAVEDEIAAIVKPIADQLTESQNNLVIAQTKIVDLQNQLVVVNGQLTSATAVIASRDAAIADLNTQIVALNGQIAALKKQLADIQNPPTTRPTGADIVPFETLPNAGRIDATANQVANGKQVSFDKATFEFTDFQANGYGLLFWTNVYGVRGSGSKNTVFQMKPNTSTAKAKVPAQPDKNKTDGSTNQLYFLRGGGNGDATPRPTVYSGFTIQGTPQGHMYNGMISYQERGGSIDDVVIKGVPGDSSVNPGETFSLNLFRTNDKKVTNLEIDGRDQSGNIVGASGIGLNFANNFDISDSYIHHSNFGAGITAYQCTGVLNYTRVRSEQHKVVAYNFEGCNVVANLRSCTFLQSPWAHMIVDAINVGASSVINIYDPVYEGSKFIVNIHSTTPGQRQKASDIHLFVGGVERPDLLQIVPEALAH